MDYIMVIVCSSLAIAGLFHFYWALGGKIFLDRVIPTEDGEALLHPTTMQTWIVGLILLACAYLAYRLYNDREGFLMAYGEVFRVLGWMVSCTFLLRVIGDFKMMGIFKRITSTQFAWWDRTFFIPLSLFWSLYFAYVSS